MVGQETTTTLTDQRVGLVLDLVIERHRSSFAVPSNAHRVELLSTRSYWL
jgi:hypothetical protein